MKRLRFALIPTWLHQELENPSSAWWRSVPIMACVDASTKTWPNRFTRRWPNSRRTVIAFWPWVSGWQRRWTVWACPLSRRSIPPLPRPASCPPCARCCRRWSNGGTRISNACCCVSNGRRPECAPHRARWRCYPLIPLPCKGRDRGQGAPGLAITATGPPCWPPC